MKKDGMWGFARERLFSEKSHLIYDHTLTDDPRRFPTEEETTRSYPNPCGYGVGMEDSMIHGGTLLDACLIRFARTGDEACAGFARLLADGLLRCAEAAKSEGFLPRSLSPLDCRSHYIDSSRDQYTLFAFGLHRYLASPLCRPEDRARIARAAAGIARRLEANVRAGTGFDPLREDGGKSLVSVMWGDTLGNHEVGRLPMLFLFAWEATGEERWLSAYRSLREEAFRRSLPMASYWHLYALQQMQVSLLLLCELDPDAGQAERARAVMREVARFTEGAVAGVREKLEGMPDCNQPIACFRDCAFREDRRFAALGMPAAVPVRPDLDLFFTLQDAANCVLVPALVPGGEVSPVALSLFEYARSRIDLSRHERAVPVHFLASAERAGLPTD